MVALLAPWNEPPSRSRPPLRLVTDDEGPGDGAALDADLLVWPFLICPEGGREGTEAPSDGLPTASLAALRPLVSEPVPAPMDRPDVELSEGLVVRPRPLTAVALLDAPPVRTRAAGLDVGLRRQQRAARRVRRHRAALGGVVVGALLLLALPLGALGGGATHAAPALSAGTTYVVQPGDTLWSIAGRLDPGADPRAVVAQIEAQVGSDQLVPGQHLRLP